MKFLQQLLVPLFASGVFAATWIVPGAVWTDTTGKTIDAHGGNIVQRGDTFYWVGQSASQSMTLFTHQSCCEAVHILMLLSDEIALMYSSTDLLNWTPLGAQNSLQYIWRPKIAKPNGSFWVRSDASVSCCFSRLPALDRYMVN
jgi:hypothetical protein